MAAIAEPVGLARGAMTPLPYRVVRNRRENHDNWTLELEPVDDALDPIGPGQFTMLYVFGVGEVPISSSGDPAQPERLVHTIRAVGAVTKALCALEPGAVLGARGPFGNRWPLEAAQRTRPRPRGRRRRPAAAAAGRLPRAREPRRHRRAAPALRRPHARRPALHARARGLARPARHARRRDRGRGAQRLARPRRRRHDPHPRRAVRAGRGGRVHRRAGDHDALHAPGRSSTAASRPSGSGSRWSGRCAAASASAATASSGRR